jgi:hypothetical protein
LQVEEYLQSAKQELQGFLESNQPQPHNRNDIHDGTDGNDDSWGIEEDEMMAKLNAFLQQKTAGESGRE